ncbi:MAG: mitochondrial fission ELM1 family protein [Synergistaceae bacterium]|jgi:mitochondrial fission protein ELM1|nr:mitochondrial fission ELM1 family protein [Synergistaceae bacterium]
MPDSIDEIISGHQSPDDWNDPIVRVARGARPPSSNLRLVVILTEGVRGHLNQSRGVASWLSLRTGAEILELEVPDLQGIRRRKVRSSAVKLLEGNRRKARDWLALAEGESVIRTLGQWLLERQIREGDTSSFILLSAGSMPSFYNIALGYIWRCTCVTIMTPSVIGTEPFDFAIVPEHDFPKDISNVLTTVGAPNMIVREDLGTVAKSLLNEFPPVHERRWGILLGGDDRNYRISPEWVQRQLGRVFQEAERSEVDLYIATSRRTSQAAENVVRRLASSTDSVRFLLIASADPLNPVPAILGACDEIFVTDDSINMVSEAVTAGHRAVLMRTDRVNAIKRGFQSLTATLVSAGILPRRALWGPSRFDRTFASFERMGHLIEFKNWLKERRRNDLSPFVPLDEEQEPDSQGFNEARRAADWILDNLGDVIRPSEDEA